MQHYLLVLRQSQTYISISILYHYQDYLFYSQIQKLSINQLVMRKINLHDARAFSPIRLSPRHISPSNRSPYSRQAPLSPLRTRRQDRTPQKNTATQNNFYRSPQSHITGVKNIRENQEKSHMHQTIKKGIGLFQTLAQKNRLNSDKKQSAISGNNSQFSQMNSQNQPSQYYSKTNEKIAQKNMGHKFSFTSLLKNVKQIESIRPQCVGQNNFNPQAPANISFKTLQKSNKIDSQYKQHQKYEKPLNRSPNTLKKTQSQCSKAIQAPLIINLKQKNQQQNYGVVSKQIGQQKISPFKCIEQNNQRQFSAIPLQSIIKSKQYSKVNIKQSENYDDVNLIIQKVSEQMGNQEQVSGEDLVKMSLQNSKSLNMKPFL